MKRMFLVTAMLSICTPALAKGVQWNAVIIEPGQGTTQQGHHALTYFAAIKSKTAYNGMFYTFTHVGTAQAEESYAIHEAIAMRKLCDESGDSSCIPHGQGWQMTVSSEETSGW